MKNYLIRHLHERLSLRLGIVIVLVITVVFSLLFGYLFYRSKRYIQQVAIDRATQLLDNTVVRITGIMDDTEFVTNGLARTTPRHLCPDSLLAFTRRAVAENPFLAGMAISMEPNFFPEMGRYFSAYSLRQGDSITTVREGPFEYFEAVWYSSPRTLGAPCWVDGFDDYNEGTLSSPDYMTSYCCPLRDADGRYLGSVTASLTLKWLSETVTALKPYPNSSAIMVGRNGTYLAHPDTAKLLREGIFTDADPRAKRDIDALGKAMLAGRSGVVETIVDDHDAFIFYTPLKRTGWSITIVRPSHTYCERSVPLSIHSPKGSWPVLKRMLDGKPVLVHGDGSSLWTLTWNEDFAHGFIGLLGNPKAIGEAFQITSDESLTWNQVYECVAAALHVEPRLYHVASDFLAAVCPADYDLTGNLIGDKAATVVFDCSKLKRAVPGFQCTTRFDEGVRRCVDYLLAHPELQVDDPEFDQWCNRVIEAQERAKQQF